MKDMSIGELLAYLHLAGSRGKLCGYIMSLRSRNDVLMS